MRVACFISSHGFGHAARTCAVLDALRLREPDVGIELFTAVPRWFFDDSLAATPGPRPGHHAASVDIGLVQTNALEEDLAATVAELERRIPFRDREVGELAGRLAGLGVDLVICDVAPLGLAVARRAGVPSLLVENFTWDWIYRGYRHAAPGLGPIADYFGELFASADHHVQTEPCCRPSPRASKVPPVSRRPRVDRRRTRERLGVPEDAELVLVTMGGIEWEYADLERRLDGRSRPWWLVVPGGSKSTRRFGRAVLLPHRSDFYHPDLIHAADAVVGKLGYSTLAEVHAAGLPFGYVPRPAFPESAELEAWVRRKMPHLRIDAASFTSGRWIERVEDLLALPRRPAPAAGGADEVARRIVEAMREHLVN